jgi:hypothetical protein
MTVRIFATTLLALALLGACATGEQSKPSGRIEEVTEARAKVAAVDQAQRRLTIEEASGEQFELQATDEVRNFDQIEVGDEVVVSYTEALAWQVKPAGEGAPGVAEEVEASRAKPGEKPSGQVGRTVTLTATITAIDLANGTVTLTGPGGQAQTIKARDPANLKKVKVGDLVDITYTEAVAIAVREVGK